MSGGKLLHFKAFSTTKLDKRLLVKTIYHSHAAVSPLAAELFL